MYPSIDPSVCLSVHLHKEPTDQPTNHLTNGEPTNQPTPWRRTLLQKLIVAYVVKRFNAFCGSRRFVLKSKNNLIIERCLEPLYSRPQPLARLSKIHFNIGLLFSPVSSRWSLVFKISDYILFLFSSFSHECYSAPSPLYRLYLSAAIVHIGLILFMNNI
jgi:hypothetical protein